MPADHQFCPCSNSLPVRWICFGALWTVCIFQHSSWLPLFLLVTIAPEVHHFPFTLKLLAKDLFNVTNWPVFLLFEFSSHNKSPRKFYIDGFPNSATPNLKHLLRFSICSKREYINPPQPSSIQNIHFFPPPLLLGPKFLYLLHLKALPITYHHVGCPRYLCLLSISSKCLSCYHYSFNNSVSVVREKEEFPVTAGLQRRNVFS